jgi:Rhodopirellula transposase DDE domain
MLSAAALALQALARKQRTSKLVTVLRICHITQNWRARPLTDRLAVVELIAATTTKTGLKVESALDTATYEKGIKVSDAEMKTLDIEGDAFHPEWNYTIRPRSTSNQSG